MSTSTPTTVAPPPSVRNDFLDRLHEIVPPDAVSWTPQTIGWYVLAGLALLAVAWRLWDAWRRWSANRFRREARAELRALEEQLNSPEGKIPALRALPGVVKRTALAAYPRVEVAGLYGESWLEFLDASLGAGEFAAGQGRLLAELAYLPTAELELLDERTTGSLFESAQRWVSTVTPTR